MFIGSNAKLARYLVAPYWGALDALPLLIQEWGFSCLSPVHGVVLKNKESIAIGKGCLIEEGAYIEGPCVIGDGTEIRHAAYIRKGSVIGNACVIGHATEVNRSLILDGAKLPHFNYVGDSIIGEGANLGAGVICANMRLDGKEILGRKKLGALVGHHATIACHTVLNPGTIVQPSPMIESPT